MGFGFRWRWNYARTWVCATKRMIGVVSDDSYGYSWRVYVRTKDGAFLRRVACGTDPSPFGARKRATRAIKNYLNNRSPEEPWHMS